MAAHLLDDRAHLAARRGAPLAQDHGDRLAGGRLVDVHRQEAALVVVGIEQGELLVTVDGIEGVVDVERDRRRRLSEAGAEQLDHRRHHARDLDP